MKFLYYIKKIDNDENLYKAILKEPIFVNDKYTDIMNKIGKDLSLFIVNIFLQDKNKAKRIDDVNEQYNCVI